MVAYAHTSKYCLQPAACSQLFPAHSGPQPMQPPSPKQKLPGSVASGLGYGDICHQALPHQQGWLSGSLGYKFNSGTSDEVLRGQWLCSHPGSLLQLLCGRPKAVSEEAGQDTGQDTAAFSTCTGGWGGSPAPAHQLPPFSQPLQCRRVLNQNQLSTDRWGPALLMAECGSLGFLNQKHLAGW